MSKPVDIDLIELRCKLRGWECTRGGYGGVRSVTVSTPATWCAIWESGVSLGETPAILTAPRWTLDRLLSDPPKGWCQHKQYGRGWLCWGDGNFVCVSVAQGLRKLRVGTHVGATDDIARLAERHKAVAELALIIAEIEQTPDTIHGDVA